MFTNKPFIVAEMSANHLGSLDRALKICKAAKEAGADAVKLQTFTPSRMVGKPEYIIPNGPWAGRALIDLYDEAHTPRAWHKQLFDYCKELGIVCFSTPFHPDDVDFLETLNCPIYKISSFDIEDRELIERCVRTGKPIILSTGMATKEQIRRAISWCEHAHTLTILKCTSAYPAAIEDAHLQTLFDMSYEASRFGVSDHTLGYLIPIMATAMGATVIEKHLTLSRGDGGPDAAFSMNPEEFGQMVTVCRAAKAALGRVVYGPGESERESVELRKSLFFNRALREGTVIEREHLKIARPALGLSPVKLKEVLGKKLAYFVLAGDPVTDDSFYH
jgi:N-acetylneuraminate synthase